MVQRPRPDLRGGCAAMRIPTVTGVKLADIDARTSIRRPRTPVRLSDGGRFRRLTPRILMLPCFVGAGRTGSCVPSASIPGSADDQQVHRATARRPRGGWGRKKALPRGGGGPLKGVVVPGRNLACFYLAPDGQPCVLRGLLAAFLGHFLFRLRLKDHRGGRIRDIEVHGRLAHRDRAGKIPAMP